MTSRCKVFVVRYRQHCRPSFCLPPKKRQYFISRPRIQCRRRFVNDNQRFIKHCSHSQCYTLALSAAYNSCSKPNSSKQAYNLSSEKGTERFTFSSNGRVTISFTHSNGSANSWGIHAICRRTTSMVDISSNVPPTWMVPSLNGTNPITAFNNEVFPQPDCPTNRRKALLPQKQYRHYWYATWLIFLKFSSKVHKKTRLMNIKPQ